MKNLGSFTKFLAIAGTILAWLPILAPVIFSLILLVAERIFRFDYLMPAELFPVVLVGSVLLFWAALRAHCHARLIGFSFSAAIIFLVGSQAIAMATGLASGRIEPTGWPWILVLVSLFAYIFSLIIIDVGGILLLRNLFKAESPH